MCGQNVILCWFVPVVPRDLLDCVKLILFIKYVNHTLMRLRELSIVKVWLLV
jgi:hypothetical protein